MGQFLVGQSPSCQRPVYLTLDGHRSNDDAVYVFISEDYGATWRSLVANVPPTAGSAHVIREDLENENLLFLGCEFFRLGFDRPWTILEQMEWLADRGGSRICNPSHGGRNRRGHARPISVDRGYLRFAATHPGPILTSGDRLLKPNSVVRWVRAKTVARQQW